MNSKYYIPKIEEFHIGFIYEYLYETNVNSKRWKTEEVIDTDLLAVFKEDIINNKVRVKYLDLEDIKGEGFTILEDNDKYIAFVLKLNDYSYEGIYYLDEKILYFSYRYQYEDTMNIKLVIKNKSEFIDFLKKINKDICNSNKISSNFEIN